jgi:hypothetical protein
MYDIACTMDGEPLALAPHLALTEISAGTVVATFV